MQAPPRRLLVVVPLLSALAACASTGEGSAAAGGRRAASFEDATRELERHAGLFEVFLDRAGARALLALPAPDGAGLMAECLYLEGLATGLGSNPVGLDRGQIGSPRVVRLRLVGERVLIEQPNLAFRALSDDADEVRATRESFATSVLWAGKVLARAADGRVLVDLTPFLVRDAHGVADTLARSGQGSWSLDAERSVLEPRACLAFPDNLEFEALLTFAGKSPGAHVRGTAPDARSVSMVQHHSLVRLPDDGYRPRALDPRSGAFGRRFLDYAAGLDESIEVAWAVRHRLEKVDPEAARSKAVEPIVYYVDRGAPEPVRGALIEGASWWARAFEAAGFEDAFRVELLPAGAHSLDVRYNVIQWVHRSTRGWSYGNSVTDPRTGEIVKGHVSLGSLRVRQDRLLFEGLAGADETGSGAPDDPIQLALARIRQLAAHEVGHTLGFAHNFSASTYAGRASVMDYPAPLVRVDASGALDFSGAYAVGIGVWDEIAVRWLYGQFPAAADEQAVLDGILAEAAERGMRYHTDADARPSGAAQPYANLWDNLADPVEGLSEALAVRRAAMGRFGERNVRTGTALARLEEVFAPVYFHHRYQLDAALKMIGGLDYDYELKGAQPARGARPIPAEDQERALAAVMVVLEPETLDVPEAVLQLLVPRPPGLGPSRELFASGTAPAFDALGAASTAARQVVAGLLQTERCTRLVDFHRRDPGLPSLEEVLEVLCEGVFAGASPDDPRLAEIRRGVQGVAVRGLIGLASAESAPPRVRERAESRLRALMAEISPGAEAGGARFDRRAALGGEIRRYLERGFPDEAVVPPPAEPPPGSPIGWGLEGCSGGR